MEKEINWDSDPVDKHLADTAIKEVKPWEILGSYALQDNTYHFFPTNPVVAAGAEAGDMEVPDFVFPSFMDSTMLAQYISCPRRFFWGSFRNRHPNNRSIHLTAGGAYAKGLEIFRRRFYKDGVSVQEATEEGFLALTRAYSDFEPTGPRDYKTWDRTVAAYLSYLKEYPPETDYLVPHFVNGDPCIEFSFSIPIPGILHPETGDPINWVGRSDLIGEQNGVLFVVDDKTTGAIGPHWSDHWKLRGQFTGYCWAAQVFGYPVAGAIIRGTAIQKTQIKHAQAITYREDWKIERWLKHVQTTLRRMVEDYQQFKEDRKSNPLDYSAWDTVEDNACNDFGGCAFTILCETPNPDVWLDNYYDHRQWNPLKKED
jgi:hypothetical protein